MDKRNVLVTAGNTRVPIDRVRGLDNIFRGRTGTRIAEYFQRQGCDVTLLCSYPHLVDVTPHNAVTTVRYATYDELEDSMRMLIETVSFGTIIHSAAVSDYRVAEVCRRVGDTAENGKRQALIVEALDRDGKIGSNHEELWMKLVPTAKLIDKIRKEWGFKGTLVKFKLQVNMSDAELIEVATRSMHHSQADFIVANTLEGMNDKAFILSSDGGEPMSTSRNRLPAALYKAVMR